MSVSSIALGLITAVWLIYPFLYIILSLLGLFFYRSVRFTFWLRSKYGPKLSGGGDDVTDRPDHAQNMVVTQDVGNGIPEPGENA